MGKLPIGLYVRLEAQFILGNTSTLPDAAIPSSIASGYPECLGDR